MRNASQLEQHWDALLGGHVAAERDATMPACRFCRGAGSLADRGRNRRTMCNACLGSGNERQATMDKQMKARKESAK